MASPMRCTTRSLWLSKVEERMKEEDKHTQRYLTSPCLTPAHFRLHLESGSLVHGPVLDASAARVQPWVRVNAHRRRCCCCCCECHEQKDTTSPEGFIHCAGPDLTLLPLAEDIDTVVSLSRGSTIALHPCGSHHATCFLHSHDGACTRVSRLSRSDAIDGR